jgi:hypothetical protein
MKANLLLGTLSLSLSLPLTTAVDLLFPQILPQYPFTLLYQSSEYLQAQARNLTTNVVSIEEWTNMTTADFAQYKAIVIWDTGSASREDLEFLNDTKGVWGPGVLGNVILIGMFLFPFVFCLRAGGVMGGVD